MSFPDFPEDMGSGFANYLGEDPSTFPHNKNPAASAPVDSLGQLSYNSSRSSDWNQFFEADGIERYSSPEIDWEWDPKEGIFVGVGIGSPSTVNEATSEEPAQSTGQDEGAHTIVEIDNTTEPPIATYTEPEPQREGKIPDDDSLFGEGDIDDNESPVPNTGEHSNGETVAVDTQPQGPYEQDQEEKADIPDDDPLFGDSTSVNIEVPKINEERQFEVVSQDTNSIPGLVADKPQHNESATSAPITADADLHNVNADDDNDSLFGGSDDNFQAPQEESSKYDANIQAAVPAQAVNNKLADTSSDDVEDLFGEEFRVGFEAELDAEPKKDSTNAIAPTVSENTGLHLPKPPRKVSKRRGLHLPDPPRAIANPQGLHLPESPLAMANSQGLHLPAPPQKSASPQGLHLPDPPRVVASSQETNPPVPPPRVMTNPQKANSPLETVTQQSVVSTSAQEQTDNQEDPVSTRHRRVRASRIPRSDMSRPKGRGQAGKVLTQLSGPAPSKLPETASSSSSGADDTAEKPTRLPRWAFGKYGSFGKPVAGSKYRKPENSANNPIRVEDEPESADKNDEVNPENQNVAQPAPEIPGTIDLTNDTEDHIASDSTIQDNQDVNHINGQDFVQSYENFQPPPHGGDEEFGQSEGSFPIAPELSFMPIVDDANLAPKLQTHQSHLALSPNNAPNAVLQHQALQHPTMQGNPTYDLSIAGGIPFVGTNNQYQVQAPEVHGTSRTDLFPNNVLQSPYTIDETGVHHAESIPQPIQDADYAYGNYEAGNLHGQVGGMAQSYIPTQEASLKIGQLSQSPAMSANKGDSTSSGVNDNRPKKRLSHERAEFGDPRVLLKYDEFKQIFPEEPTRGCFEVAIQNERAEDAAIVARGGVPPQRPTIRKAIFCTWSQVRHLNRIRSATGERLFGLKPKAHKRSAALQESMQRKRKERGETSESEEFDMEPEPKRLRLAQEPIKMAPEPREHHGILQGLYSQNMGQAPSFQIHQPVAQSFKRQMAPEQLESFESMEQEMRPQVRRPRIAPQMGGNIEPKNNQSLTKEFQDYISQRQSEYLKLRVPELRQLCSTREVQHGRFNQLMKGGLVGILVGQDVSRHPVYSQMHNQSAAGVRNHVPNVGALGGMNQPPVPVNRGQQQSRAPNGLGIRQGPTRPNYGPVHGMGSNYHQQAQPQFHQADGYKAPGPTSMGTRSHAQSATNSGLRAAPAHGYSRSANVVPAPQLHMNGNSSALANQGGQPLTSLRQPQHPRQGYQDSMMNPNHVSLYPQSRLPVSAHNSGYNNSGVQQNVNGGRNNQLNGSAQIPAHGIYGGFGNGVYRPAVDDRRRRPRIQGRDAPSRVPRGAQRSIPQPAMNLPQPAMDNTSRRYVSHQQPMVGATSGNLHGGQQVDTRVSTQHLCKVPLRKAGQQHAATPGFSPPYLGRAPGNAFNGQPPGPAPPG
ncbi:hypothetical protein BOTCAL_0333g00030 [Botryotinia calthae]|uniref:Uncharacterized protein n=1 Tax=Botryotinia calthae TaxID=38488 RepID=A0A4Y8CVS7_9HELO|nr:hypothetical protein BOTCAL_0333g00030 [Botryotinia calthae]